VPTTDTLIAQVGKQLDLVAAPFTLPRSRILVQRHPDTKSSAPTTSLRVSMAEYERPLADCVVFDSLSVADTAGRLLPVTRVLPHQIEFDHGRVTLGFAGPHSLSFGLSDIWSTETQPRDAAGLVPGIEPDFSLELRIDLPGGGHRAQACGPGLATSVLLSVGADHTTTLSPGNDNHGHLEHLRQARQIWADWFDRCPRVRPDLQAMTALCWWVLGANIVELPAQGNARAVVPSKIGYVGLWQWDAYFIAVGLRHGDAELAREQLDLAFRFATIDGQLPDVVHDDGVLASSDDLPPADRETLRALGSSVADPSAPVPLTKPPLAAWALSKVLEKTASTDVDSIAEWTAEAWQAVARSQDWWFVDSDLDGDGMPEYGHPYSSGLDDSPIFDGPFPLASPDLGAYLVLQDRLLCHHFTAAGETDRATACTRRADRTFKLLQQMWDAPTGRFLSRAGDKVVTSYAAVSLLPLLTGELLPDQAAALVAALHDPVQFGTPWGVPTVAVDDPAFSMERMWRGPVWVNINALLVEGLKASGFAGEAARLAEQTVALVINAQGPSEYFNPATGQKAKTATTSFGWSAALFVDLAVQLSS
jgi:hypothetical protein